MRIVIIFLLCINFTTAQNLSRFELIDLISTDICEEIQKMDLKTLDSRNLGLQMIQSFTNYDSDLKNLFGKGYLINDEVMQDFAQEIGVSMGLKCPAVFIDMFEDVETEANFDYLTVVGKFNKIKKGEFLTFTIKESSGKTHEFLLLNEFETAYLITDEILKKDETIEVTFFASEIYNAKIGRYVNYNIVTYIEKK
nr:hypothetical protein [uncultured Flavobacterium sp.]